MTEIVYTVEGNANDSVMVRAHETVGNKYVAGYEPKVEICNVHGTGFILKVRS